MNKNKIFNFFKSILCGGGIFICITLLTSCENFLKNDQVKNEIINAIAYNNAVSCNISLKADSQTGEFLEGNQIQIKVGYDEQVQFFVNQENFYFVDLTAVCVTNYNESRSDFIEFECLEKDEKKGLYTYSVKLLKEAKDIAIRPVCYEYPKITSYSPASTKKDNQANVPIKVDFNVPFEDASVFNYDNIILEAFNEPADSMFEAPALSEDGLTLSIYPKATALVNKIKEKNAAVMTLKISFTDKIRAIQNEIPLPLKQNNNSSFTVYYIPEIEETAPQKKDFFITGKEISISTAASVAAAEKFTDESINSNAGFTEEQYAQKIFQNLVKDTVYIYGCFYDKDSGVKTVMVKEQTTNHAVTGQELASLPKTFYYRAGSDNAEFFTENGETRFCIKHKITSVNGLAALDITVLDACENAAKVKRHYVVRKNGFEDGNTADDLLFFQVGNNLGLKTGEINTEQYHETIKTVSVVAYLFDGQECWFPPNLYNKVILPQDAFEIKCKYTDKNGVNRVEAAAINDSFTNGYRWDVLLDVDTVANLSFSIYAKDLFGNEMEKTYTIPKGNDFTVTLDPKDRNYYGNIGWVDEDPDKYTCNVYNKLDYTDYPHILLRTESDGKKYYDKTYDNSSLVEKGYNYSIIPVLFDRTSDITGMSIRLIGEISNTSFKADDYQDVSLAPVEIEDYYISKTDKTDIIDINIKLKPGTWENFDEVYINTKVSGIGFTFDKTTGIFTHRGNAVLVKVDGDYRRKVTVLGKKGLAFVESPEFTIGNLEGESLCEYDNVPPIFNGFYTSHNNNMKELPEENHCVILCDDSLSEPDSKKGKIKILDDNNNTLATHSWNKVPNEGIHYFRIPVWELMPMTGLYRNIKYEIYDNAGNVAADTINSLNVVNNTTVHFKEMSDEGKLSIVTGVSSYNNFQARFYKYNSDNSWELIKSGSNVWASISSVQTIIDPVLGQVYLRTYNPFVSDSLSVNCDNSFIKLAPQDINYSTLNTIYFYNGTPGSGDYDWFISNGESKDSMLVSSDAPVLIHTYITQLPYETCKDWSIQEWETYKQSCGEKCIAFSNSDHGQRRYSIPVNEISDGSCYCAIAHFSDNHIEKSPVFQK